MKAFVVAQPTDVMVYRSGTSVTVDYVLDLTAFTVPSGALTGCTLVLSAVSDIHTPSGQTGDRIVSGSAFVVTNASTVSGNPLTYGRTVSVNAPSGILQGIAGSLGGTAGLSVEVTGSAGSTGSYTRLVQLGVELRFNSSLITWSAFRASPNPLLPATIPMRHRYRGSREGLVFVASTNAWCVDLVSLERWRGQRQEWFEQHEMTVADTMQRLQHLRRLLQFQQNRGI